MIFLSFWSYVSDDTSIATISPIQEVVLTSAPHAITANKVGTGASTFITMTCTASGNAFEFINKIPVTFNSIVDPYASTSGDPHFKQPIIDRISGEMKQICYDVTGQSGDIINIVGFNNHQITFSGELMDDYYIHKIIIKSQCENITVTTNFLSVKHIQSNIWQENDVNFQSECFNFAKKKNKIYISTKSKLNFKSPLNFFIEKLSHSISEVHLDIGFKISPNDYPQMTGILGTIGQKKFSFFENTQEKKENKRRSAIMIDGKVINAQIQTRNNSPCWLVDINYLMTLEQKQKFHIK